MSCSPRCGQRGLGGRLGRADDGRNRLDAARAGGEVPRHPAEEHRREDDEDPRPAPATGLARLATARGRRRTGRGLLAQREGQGGGPVRSRVCRLGPGPGERGATGGEAGRRQDGRAGRGGLGGLGAVLGAAVEVGARQPRPDLADDREHSRGVPGSLVGVAGGGHGDEGVELLRDLGHPRGRSGDPAVDVLVGDVDGGVAGERLRPGQHLEEDEARGIHVAAGVGDPALHLLGGEVGDGAEDHPVRGGARLRRHRPGEAEVGDLDGAVGAEDDVLGLDVAVDEPGRVGGREGLEHRLEDVERGARGERALGLDDLPEGLPGDVLHREEHLAGVLALVEDLDDVGVAQSGGGACLAPEAGDERLVVNEVRAHDLERHLAVEPGVEGEVDRRHSAVGDVLEDLVPAIEQLADEGVGGGGGHVGSVRSQPPTSRIGADGRTPPPGRRRAGGGRSRPAHIRERSALTFATYRLVSPYMPCDRSAPSPW